MSKPGRASMSKRNRERDQKERQQHKAEQKALRREIQKKERALAKEAGVDPDLIGIVAGPQPPRED